MRILTAVIALSLTAAIETVLAVFYGNNDERDWRWVLLLKDGRYVFLIGGCDYTGWDCQSDASSTFTATAEAAADLAATEDFSFPDADERALVVQTLRRQLAEGRSETWRDEAERNLGLR